MMLDEEAHHRGRLISHPDAPAPVILVGNGEIKARRDICLQALTLEKTPDSEFPPQEDSDEYRASRKIPKLNYRKGLCPADHRRINSN